MIIPLFLLVGGEDRDQAALAQYRAGLPIEERIVTVVRVVDLGPFVRATAAGADEDVPPLLDGVIVTDAICVCKEHLEQPGFRVGDRRRVVRVARAGDRSVTVGTVVSTVRHGVRLASRRRHIQAVDKGARLGGVLRTVADRPRNLLRTESARGGS